MVRLLKWLVILGILGGGLTYGGMQLRSWWEQRAKPSFLTSAITRGRVETTVSSTGTIKPKESVSVGAFVSGPIDEVLVNFNSKVTVGQVLATIDPRLLQAAVDRDLAAVESQQADLARVEALRDQAKNNEERAEKLRAINPDYLADTERDQFRFNRASLEAQVKLAEASIKQVEANLKNSRTNLKYADITSPVNGIIIERKIDPGQTVASSFQTPELFIIALDMEKEMYVFASVDEADIGEISAAKEAGKPVKFRVDAYRRKLFTGVIKEIRKNATTTQNVVTYPVVVSVDIAKMKEEPGMKDVELLPGMTANLTFEIKSREDVLRIPAAALRFIPQPAHIHPEDRHYVEAPLVTSGGKKAEKPSEQERLVWVKEGDLLRAVPVRLGLVETRYAELTKGDLTEGQELVIGTETGRR